MSTSGLQIELFGWFRVRGRGRVREILTNIAYKRLADPDSKGWFALFEPIGDVG